MQRWYSLFLPRFVRSIVWIAILIAFAISLLALIGWILDIALLTRVRPQWIRMSVITAACLILTIAQLVLLQVTPSSLRRFKVLQVQAVVVSLVGLLTIALYCFTLVTGQEPSFGFAPFLNLFWAPETRLALLTAISFLLIGIALTLLANGSGFAANIAHTLILPGAIISYFVLISYLLGVQAWHGWLDVPMALNTGLAFTALSVAIFCVRPDTWLMAVLTSDQAGGIMARRLLPTLLIIPLLIGWLRLYGERTGAFESEVGVALVAVAYTFCLLSLVLLTAASLNRADLKHRQAEGARLESDARFKAFMDNSPAIAWAKDETGRYVYLSKACEDRFNLHLENCRDKTDFDLWPQAVAEKFRQNDLEVLARGQTIEVIEENIDPDGRRCYWWNFKFPFSDATGVRYVGGVGVDITELKQTEKALQESQEDLNRAQVVAQTGSWRLEARHNKLLWSDETYRIFGISQGTPLTYETFLGAVHSDDRQYVDHKWTAALQGEPYDIEHRIIVDGAIKWVREKAELEFGLQGALLGGFGTVQDITERKRAEKALRQSEAQLRTIFDNLTEGVVVSTLDGHLLTWNRAAMEMHGYSSLDEVRRPLAEFPDTFELLTLGGEALSLEQWPLSRILRGEQLRDLQVRVRHRHSDWERITNYSGALVRDQEGTPLLAIVSMADITERKQAEEDLLQSEASLAEAQRIAHLGNWKLDLERNEFTLSDEIYRIFGLDPQEFIPTIDDFLNFVHPEDLPAVTHQLEKGRTSGKYGPFDYRVIRRDGSIRYVYARGETRYDQNGRPLVMVGIGQDITERKLGEEALRQAHDELDQRVKERTEELHTTVIQLQEEVTERLQAEKALRESEQNLRYLASRILTAQEQERKRIALELHDGLAQSMTTLKMQLRAIHQHLPAKEASIIEDFDDAYNLIINMVEDVRRISQGLSPILLEDLGLTAALKHLLDDLGNREKITITADIDDIRQLFSTQTEINLFRVMQESLNNIAKHARSTNVSVCIKRQNGTVNFLIKDNGIGFDQKKLTRKKIAAKGMGLASMEERLRMIGALLNIMSKPGEGTEISFSVPCDAI